MSDASDTATELTEKQLQAIKDFDQFDAWTEARMLPVDCLEFTSWNVNEMTNAEFAELVSEIEENGYHRPDGSYVPGFDEPVGVIPIDGEPGRYIVPSGEHRTRAAISLEMTHVPCVLKVHLTEKDRSELEMWSVKRNNVRGRVNAQKYAALEEGWSKKKQIRAEAARKRLLIKGETLKRLRKSRSVQANEEGGGSEAMGGEGAKKSTQLSKDAPAGDSESSVEADDAPSYPVTPEPAKHSTLNPKEEERQRRKLEADFRAAWEECLLDSGDTIKHGYLVFAKNGKTSVVVDEPNHLHKLVKRAVDACKSDSARLSELLTTALTKELPAWEDR